ncbi:MAG TPA: alpha/beta fold hydrolase, partial [Gammaproteobacteria bacterium]|nr:alpha/beta fold hydrolase [Gammaproteobacteria bacterium]
MPDFDTHRVIEGSGPCVVLIHGVGLDHKMWSAQAKAMRDRFKVLRYDLIGHGESPTRPGRIGLDDFTAQIAALLDQEGIDRAHVVGFSLGALIAQAFALKYPQRLKRLVLISGVYDRDDAARASVLNRLQQAERDGTESIIEAALDRWFTDAYRKSHSQEVETIEQRLKANTREGFLSAYRLFAEADRRLADRLGAIGAPTLVVTGEDDTGSTPEMAERMSEAM